MSEAPALVAALRARGLVVEARGDAVQVRPPAGITPSEWEEVRPDAEERALLAERWPEILALLRGEAAANIPPYTSTDTAAAAESTPPPPEPEPAQDAQAPATGEASTGDMSRVEPAPPDGPASPGQAYVRLSRGCLECGRDFVVNPFHAEAHRFCSARCRAKHHRATRGRASSDAPHVSVDGAPVLAASASGPVHAVPVVVVPAGAEGWVEAPGVIASPSVSLPAPPPGWVVHAMPGLRPGWVAWRQRGALRAEVRRRLAERLAHPTPAALPPPRYDDVFFEGVRMLDACAGPDPLAHLLDEAPPPAPTVPEVVTPSLCFERDLAEYLRRHRPEARKPLAKLAPVLRIIAVLDMDPETAEAITAYAEAS